MRPTSDARDETEDRDPYNAEPVRSDPWASGPGHLTQDEPTERYVPEQRDPGHDSGHDSGHDGHVYASDTYAEPETTVLTDQDHGKDASSDAKADASHDNDEPTAVGVAHVDTDHAADDAEAKADDAEAKAEDAQATANNASA